MKKTILFYFTLLTVTFLNAQVFEIDADLRQRFEYRHGFSTLFPDNTEPAAFVRQRARLNFNYSAEKLQVFIALQDVSTWGDTRQILSIDGNDSFMLFQAWEALTITQDWSVKLGRQVIAYDDQRIFGGLDWAMQGRFHDAALLKYNKQSFKMDLGVAYSQQGEPTLGNTYTIPGFFTYKTMQYAYFKKSWAKASLSLLALNTGYQNFEDFPENTLADGMYYMQTLGSYFTFPVGPLSITGSAYYQLGDAYPIAENLSAYQATLEINYSTGKILFKVGAELLSGSDQGSSARWSFFPLYGTNHKFNGFMDYFYVGNHLNSVGLNDFYTSALLKTGENSNLLLAAHYFAANGKLAADANSYLGTEIDLVYTQPLFKDVNLQVGYSHMFASESMGLIKGGTTTENVNNWAWAMLVINPRLFNYNFEK
ncbi:alginate export family protein [Flavimarina sp. Hel_I_48]|uniref:alginate export family protein n=1 Tax=Flavimarina sp. Hel_I_48 TaxID=1392488 RepID=UPI0004DF2A88|nr:alginate export family protein [Flavimarina sp. Hel_I_48]